MTPKIIMDAVTWAIEEAYHKGYDAGRSDAIVDLYEEMSRDESAPERLPSISRADVLWLLEQSAHSAMDNRERTGSPYEAGLTLDDLLRFAEPQTPKRDT